MEKFRKVMNGYDKNQVNEYIQALILKNQSSENTLREKIGLLEEEVLNYKREISSYKNKESALTDAMLKITDYEKKVREDADEERDIECERAEVFKRKWEEYAYELLRMNADEGIKKMNELVENYRNSVQDKIETNLKLKKDRYENERILTTDAEKLSGLCKKLGIFED